ncbi:MAG TPA: Hsp20/alpha crystallin family protein [Burkholderiales bacterium]|nr:Hsp20/alpha crystallin family protein [Burkholderiales bacterium]
MAGNITRYDPLSMMDTDLDDWFKGFFLRPISLQGQPSLQIKMDVSENDKAYKVRAEIPGVKKEDIAVNIDEKQVAISAEVKEEKEKKDGEKVVHKERYYGNVFRSFTLPQDVDEKAAQAHYEDGVLELTLPKRPASKAKQLTIS